MVTVKQPEDDYCSFKDGSSCKPPWCLQMPCKGYSSDVNIPIYRFSTGFTKCNGVFGVEARTADQQTLLDMLYLSQWEDCTWKGLLQYDVTACETKVVEGWIGLIAQLNELWESDYKNEVEANVFKLEEELLFCVVNGHKASSELIPSGKVPQDADLVVLNANPVEYGHVFLVSHSSQPKSLAWYARSVQMVITIAAEIKNCSFRAFYDYSACLGGHNQYFQACYFTNPLPVEHMPIKPVSGAWTVKGVQICVVEGYPVKALLFKSTGSLQVLVKLISEICSCLQEQKISFSLLVSEYGTKIFLFLQANSCRPLSAWNCGGYFVFNSREEFDTAREDNILKHLAAYSLDESSFQDVKQLCCRAACRVAF